MERRIEWHVKVALLLVVGFIPLAGQAGERGAALTERRAGTDAPPIFTEYSLPPGGFAFHVTAGPDGFWFTEPAANRIGVFRVADGQITEYPIPTANSFPSLITYCPDGNLWFTEYLANKIAKCTPEGIITEFPVPTANSQPFAVTCTITPPPDDRFQVWFTEAIANQIGRADVVGDDVIITEYPVPTPMSTPSFITPFFPGGADGSIWFTEAGSSQVGKLAISSGSIVELPLPSPSIPQGIAPGADGMLYVMPYFFGNGLVRINPLDGAMREYPIRPNSGAFNSAAAPDGAQYFTEQLVNGIGRFDLVTGTVQEWDLAGGPSGITSFVESCSGCSATKPTIVTGALPRGYLAVMEPDLGRLAIAQFDEPTLTLTKVGSPDPVHIDDLLIYTFTVTNNSPRARVLGIREDPPQGDLELVPDQPGWLRPYRWGGVESHDFTVLAGQTVQLHLGYFVRGEPFRLVVDKARLYDVLSTYLQAEAASTVTVLN